MRQRLRQRGRLVAVAAVGLALAAAASGVAVAVLRDERACTLIGADDGISVRLEDRVPGLSRAVTCSGGRCTEVRRNDEYAPRSGYVPLPDSLARPGEADLVLVLDRRERRTKTVTTRATLRRFEPNGPGCGTYWRAAAAYRNGALVQVD